MRQASAGSNTGLSLDLQMTLDLQNFVVEVNNGLRTWLKKTYTNRIPILKHLYQVPGGMVEVRENQNSKVAPKHVLRPCQMWRGTQACSVIVVNGELKPTRSTWNICAYYENVADCGYPFCWSWEIFEWLALEVQKFARSRDNPVLSMPRKCNQTKSTTGQYWAHTFS